MITANPTQPKSLAHTEAVVGFADAETEPNEKANVEPERSSPQSPM